MLPSSKYIAQSIENFFKSYVINVKFISVLDGDVYKIIGSCVNFIFKDIFKKIMHTYTIVLYMGVVCSYNTSIHI